MRKTTNLIVLVISLIPVVLSRRFTAHHANLLLRSNPSLHCSALQCIHGTCVNFGMLVNKGSDELCICKYGFHGDHCEFQASTDVLNGDTGCSLFGGNNNIDSLIWSITIIFVMISIIFLAGGYFIGKMGSGRKNIQMENQIRVPKISRPVSKAPSTANLVANNLIATNLVNSNQGLSQSRLTLGLRTANSINSIHRRSFSEGAGVLLGDNESSNEKSGFLNGNTNTLKVPEV